MLRRLKRRGAALVLLLFTAGCGARQLTLPSGPGNPRPDFTGLHAAVAAPCRDVRTLTAVLSLSGRAADEPVRGTVHAGLRHPNDLRFEGLTPFGSTVFVLAATGQGATLWLSGEDRVVRDPRPDAILGALTGVTFGAADLLAILTGCLVPDPVATAGQTHDGGFTSIDLEGGAQLFLRRQDGVWRVRAGRRGGWQVEYDEWREGWPFPGRVRLITESPVRVDVRVGISDLRTNVELPDAAFGVDIPATATPLSIEALRESGPLRGVEAPD